METNENGFYTTMIKIVKMGTEIERICREMLESKKIADPPPYARARIETLSKKEMISQLQAAMMHTILGLRNIDAHEQKKNWIGYREAVIAAAAWEILSDWWSGGQRQTLSEECPSLDNIIDYEKERRKRILHKDLKNDWLSSFTKNLIKFEDESDVDGKEWDEFMAKVLHKTGDEIDCYVQSKYSNTESYSRKLLLADFMYFRREKYHQKDSDCDDFPLIVVDEIENE